jgi:hypothetical protein
MSKRNDEWRCQSATTSGGAKAQQRGEEETKNKRLSVRRDVGGCRNALTSYVGGCRLADLCLSRHVAVACLFLLMARLPLLLVVSPLTLSIVVDRLFRLSSLLAASLECGLHGLSSCPVFVGFAADEWSTAFETE